MAKKVTLPPLPGKEPVGSMLVYLDQMRQKQKANSLENEELVNATETRQIPENSHLLTEPTKQQPNELSVDKDEMTVETTLVIQDEGVELATPPGELANEMSKNLDKPMTLELVDPEKINTTGLPEPSLTPRVNESSSNLKKKGKGVSPSTNFSLVDYLNKLPVEFTNYSYTKGEMKVRVSEDMAYFLKLLNDCCPEAKAIRYLTENLINKLLWQFFQTYGAEIEAMSREMERQRQINLTQRMGSLRNH